MLRLDGVRYRYAGASRPSLLDITLELGDGQVIGLTGASEAGKSTVCLVAAGLAPRAIRGELSGRLTIDGDEVATRSIEQLLTSVGICFQDPATQLSGVCDTVYEEVAFGPMNLGLPLADVIERTESALDALGIEHLMERDPAQLSGGQAQLVALAGILAMRPAHLILDEPTAQLDPQGTALVSAAVRALAESGASILIAEQKTDVLAGLCDQVIVLEAGRVAMRGAAAEVLADPRLVALGVAEPSPVRLRRLAIEAGLDPAVVEAAA